MTDFIFLGATDIKVNAELPLGLWLLICTAMVFFMQCGFAMLETGFTRAKNAGNIIMKNIVNFCIGTVAFLFLGFGLMMSERNLLGFIGIPDFLVFRNFTEYITKGQAVGFVSNLVFCTTAATIVSGAMAERTKFSAYCIYSAVISGIIYPIEAGWVRNSYGWLNQLGYTDFAGSSTVHMAGGISALVGAFILGPRIGKYTKDEKGNIKSSAIPGHSLTISALGCFILWFGWYGFNGAGAADVIQLSTVFITTTIAPAVSVITCILYTWWKNGKPDVSMCLNAVLAGLVAITAGCTYVDAKGSLIIGAVSGILIVTGVEFIDKKLHIDDPAGAVAVHGINGIWGTVAVGLLDKDLGLFYSGKFDLLGVQLLGVIAITAFTVLSMTAVFLSVRYTAGLRASREDEILGMDISEHGLASAYADFLPSAPFHTSEDEFDLDLEDLKPVRLSDTVSRDGRKYTKITIICNEYKFGVLKDAMTVIGVTGMTVSNVVGCGVQKGKTGSYHGIRMSMNLIPKVQVDIVVSIVNPALVVAVAQKALHTGKVGDGKIFVSQIDDVMRVRTGEMGTAALDNDE